MTSSTNSASYRVQAFAEMAGVTVRALHHCDRLGLLQPGRSEAGYRLYNLGDLQRLEQIVALKFIGIPLKQIKILLVRHTLDLPSALRMQRRILEDKRRLLDSAIHAIQSAEDTIRPGEQADAALLKQIIEVIEMQNSSEWAQKYYSEEALETLHNGQRKWSPELQERVSKEWTELFRDIEALLAANPVENPASEKAKQLGARWMKLVEGFTGGDPQVAAGLNRLYADRASWPAETQQQMSPYSNKTVWEFIHRVIACEKK